MKKIAILLLSDQVIPNVLFIKHFLSKGILFDEIVYVTTEKMENKKTSENITNVIGKMNKTFNVIVNQDNFIDIINNLKNYLENFEGKDNEFYVNLTGGTKLMSLAAYKVFSEIKKSKFYYMPIGKNTIQYLEYLSDYVLCSETDKDQNDNISGYTKIVETDENKNDNKKISEKNEESINVRITLGEYLKSYGVNFKIKGNIFDKSYQNTNRIFETYTNHSERLDEEKNKKLRELRNLDERKLKNQSFSPDMQEYIKNIGFEDEIKMEKKFLEYITGGWFEEWTYNFFKERYKIDGDKIGCNIETKIDFAKAGKTVQDEFDVLFVYNNALYYIECKSSLKEKGVAGETLHKINSLKDDFGLNVKSALFVADGSLRDPHNKETGFKQGIKERADLHNIAIFDKEILQNKEKLEEELKKFIK